MRTSARGYALAVTVLLLGAPAQPLSGQDVRQPPAGTFLPDSSIWLPVMIFAVETLSSHLVRAATDTTSQPWRMTFPSASAPWPMFERHLRVALRARNPVPEDSLIYNVQIGDVDVSGDTARLHLTIGATRPCRPSSRTSGYVNRFDVVVPRLYSPGGPYWGPARSNTMRHGDSLSC